MAETPLTFNNFLGSADPRALIGATRPWLTKFRQAARDQLETLGLPTPSQEAWKYSNLPRALRALAAAAEGDAPLTVSPEAVSPEALPPRLRTDSRRLVFVNGVFNAELSDQPDEAEGLTLRPLSALLTQDGEPDDDLAENLGTVAEGEDQALYALNSERFQDGLLLEIGAQTSLSQTIEVLHLNGRSSEDRTAAHPRLLVLLADQAQAELIEQHWGLDDGQYLVNQVAEIRLGQAAKLTHLRLQQDGFGALHLANQHVELGRNASYRSFNLVTGAAFSRQEIRLRLIGEGAEVDLNGIYMLRGKQHADIHTTIDHRVPHTTAREVFRGVLDDEALAAFQGKIAVGRQAQKTDGRMLNKTLLLSDRAQIKTKPELEIFADDVQCAHGATTGEIDEDALFYLRSRGIGEERARALMVQAFLAETIEESLAEDLATQVKSYLDLWMQAQDTPLAAE